MNIKRLNFLLITGLIIILPQCKNNKLYQQNENIHDIDLVGLMNKKADIKMSDFCSEVNFVMLESNPEWFFPSHSLQKKVYSDFIVFVDSRKADVVIYKRTGEFVMHLDKRGKGPGEFLRVTDYGFNNSFNNIYILEGYKSKLHWYDLKGDILKSIELPTQIDELYIQRDGSFLALNNRYDSDIYDNHRIIHMDMDGNFIKSVWDKAKEIPDRSNFKNSFWIRQGYNERLFRDNHMSDTLYNINSDQNLLPIINMDFGNKKPQDKDLEDVLLGEKSFLDFLEIHRYWSMKDGYLLQGSYKTFIYYWINRKTGAGNFSEELIDDMLGLTFPVDDQTIDGLYLSRSIDVQYYKDNLDQLFKSNDVKNKSLQEKLKRAINEADENSDKIMIYYKLNQ